VKPMSDDQSRIYNSLRASTAAMLGYSEIDLTAAQEIRLSRAISLRLICDAAQAAQLCGRPYDVRAFTDASEALEKMCGGNLEQTSGPDYDAAVHQIEALLDGIISDKQRKAAQDPDKARAEFEAKLQLAIEKHAQPEATANVSGAVRHAGSPPLTNNEDFEDPASGDAQCDGAVRRLSSLQRPLAGVGLLPSLLC
jgi:hypothetical protein